MFIFFEVTNHYHHHCYLWQMWRSSSPSSFGKKWWWWWWFKVNEQFCLKFTIVVYNNSEFSFWNLFIHIFFSLSPILSIKNRLFFWLNSFLFWGTRISFNNNIRFFSPRMEKNNSFDNSHNDDDRIQWKQFIHDY